MISKVIVIIKLMMMIIISTTSSRWWKNSRLKKIEEKKKKFTQYFLISVETNLSISKVNTKLILPYFMVNPFSTNVPL